MNDKENQTDDLKENLKEDELIKKLIRQTIEKANRKKVKTNIKERVLNYISSEEGHMDNEQVEYAKRKFDILYAEVYCDLLNKKDRKSSFERLKDAIGDVRKNLKTSEIKIEDLLETKGIDIGEASRKLMEIKLEDEARRINEEIEQEDVIVKGVQEVIEHRVENTRDSSSKNSTNKINGKDVIDVEFKQEQKSQNEANVEKKSEYDSARAEFEAKLKFVPIYSERNNKDRYNAYAPPRNTSKKHDNKREAR